MSKTLYYRTKDGSFDFKFRFESEGDAIAITCLRHPPLNGRNPHPTKTHLFDSGRICFVAGREPKNQEKAEHYASEWAEYLLRYIRTGRVES